MGQMGWAVLRACLVWARRVAGCRALGTAIGTQHARSLVQLAASHSRSFGSKQASRDLVRGGFLLSSVSPGYCRRQLQPQVPPAALLGRRACMPPGHQRSGGCCTWAGRAAEPLMAQQPPPAPSISGVPADLWTAQCSSTRTRSAQDKERREWAARMVGKCMKRMCELHQAASKKACRAIRAAANALRDD